MPKDLLLPSVSADMTEARIDNWKVSEGSTVNKGDLLLEIETDKAVVEVLAEEDGVVGTILVKPGEMARAGEPIGVLLLAGESADAMTDRSPATTAANGQQPPMQQRSAAASLLHTDTMTPGERVFASPVARRMATNAGIDIAAITGTGPRNRIVKNDVLNFLAQNAGREEGKVARLNLVPQQPTQGDSQNFRTTPHSLMRKTIAKRLQASKRDIPHFYLTADMQIDALLAVRSELNNHPENPAEPLRLSINDFIVRATALALRRFPMANSSWEEEAIRTYSDIDISIAVATPNGLITPIVRSADGKGLKELSYEIRGLAERARDGKLQPHEFQGGGFTISNLGMYGIKEFSAIINPPQSCILAVGAAEQRPVVRDGELAVGNVMTCTLSVDHRTVDGAVAAQLLGKIKHLIEHPIALLL